jgi:hypothetical protein
MKKLSKDLLPNVFNLVKVLELPPKVLSLFLMFGKPNSSAPIKEKSIRLTQILPPFPNFKNAKITIASAMKKTLSAQLNKNNSTSVNLQIIPNVNNLP